MALFTIPHWPLPAVRDLTRDSRWSTYDVNVLKLSNVSFRGKCARMGNTLQKLPSPTKLAPLGHFPSASQAGRLAGPVFYVYVFSLVFTEGGMTEAKVTRRSHESGSLSILPPSTIGRHVCPSFCPRASHPAAER